MPNHCMNRVEVYGDKDQVKELKEFVDGETNFDFNKIVPMPKELRGTTAPNPEPDSFQARKLRKLHGADNWYEWSNQNWGTKWNSYHDEVEYDGEGNPESIVYRFDTAWSPPEPVIVALRKKFPDLGITAFFDEPGMEIAGYY
jgi:hypothetical protein